MSNERKSAMAKLRSIIGFGRQIKKRRSDNYQLPPEDENQASKQNEKLEMLKSEQKQLNAINEMKLRSSIERANIRKVARKRMVNFLNRIQMSVSVKNRLRKKLAQKKFDEKKLNCFLENNVDEEVFWDALEYLDSCEPNDCSLETKDEEEDEEEEEEEEEESEEEEDEQVEVDEDGEAVDEDNGEIPTFLYTKNCHPKLIKETRELVSQRYLENPQHFYKSDFDRMLVDDWTVSRFLLRRRSDPRKAAALMEDCGRFRRQYKMSEVIMSDFPIEFHKSGGLFQYLPDRVGNQVAFMRIRMYRRTSEMRDIFKSYILCLIEQCDQIAKGRGTALVFDLTGVGLRNVDLAFLAWLLSAFRNYCPKGVSYILVYNLPWFLSATAKLAMTWMSENNRRSLRFVQGAEIENFIAKENLPDYCGGTCKVNYRQIPKESRPAIELCHEWDMTVEHALRIRELFKEYLDDEEEEVEDNNDDNNNIPRTSNEGIQV